MTATQCAPGYDYTNGADLLLQLTFADVSATFINTIESPSAFLHNYAVNDINSMMRIRRLRDVLPYRLGVPVSVSVPRGVPNGKHADFALVIDKPDRQPIYWEDYKKHLKSPFDFLLGTDEENSVVAANLDDMPHLLIAGETGGGKSVLLHSVIQSLNHSRGDKPVNYTMIDTKRAELTAYKDAFGYSIPDVCTTFREAYEALFFLNRLMDEKYIELEKKGAKKGDFCREIVIVDELADLMLQDRKHIEPLLIRLAQMGRAANIHLILATQRPTVDVCTGHIKANVSSRIALKTASARDSMNIIDRKGAESLRGKGDALVKLSTDTELRHIQCFSNKTKIKKLY